MNTTLEQANAQLAGGGVTGNFGLWCLIPETQPGSSWTDGTSCGSLVVCDQSGYWLWC